LDFRFSHNLGDGLEGQAAKVQKVVIGHHVGRYLGAEKFSKNSKSLKISFEKNQRPSAQSAQSMLKKMLRLPICLALGIANFHYL